MIYVMNSAVMTSPGRYELREIPRDEFLFRIAEALEARTLVSRIGYPQNARLIAYWSAGKIDLPLSRAETRIKPGDEMLCMTLRYRTDGYKGKEVAQEDFQFFHCKYYPHDH